MGARVGPGLWYFLAAASVWPDGVVGEPPLCETGYAGVGYGRPTSSRAWSELVGVQCGGECHDAAGKPLADRQLQTARMLYRESDGACRSFALQHDGGVLSGPERT
eukprot:scaffold1809_cov386-Prasinococcus_capsulatus_cf.AAC.17